MSYIEIISGHERRRPWSEEQKQAVLAAAFAPGAVVRDVARKTDIQPSLIYRWRRQQCAKFQMSGFSQVKIVEALPSPATPPPAVSMHELPAIELEMSGQKVRIPATMPPALAAAVIKALTGGR